MDSNPLLSASLLTVTEIFTSGSSSVVSLVLFNGQEISLCQRNPGPLNRLEEDVFLFASNPYEASSVGFSLEDRQLH